MPKPGFLRCDVGIRLNIGLSGAGAGGGAARLYRVPLRKSSARSTASLEFFQSSFS